jgi:MFS family permease
MKWAVGGFVLFVILSLWPWQAGSPMLMVMYLLTVAFGILIPIGLLAGLCHFVQKTKQLNAKNAAETVARMTPEEQQAYANRPPLILTIWPALVVLSLVLLCVMMPYASPVVLVIWAAKLVNSKKTQRALTRECTPVRSQAVDDHYDQTR